MLPTKAPLPFKRIDWQYLLPLPATGKVKHLHYLGNPIDTKQQQLQTIGETITVGESIPVACDLLFADYHQQPKVSTYRDSLNENGILLLEVQRNPLQFWKKHPQNLSTSLQKQGFTIVDIVWVAPSFEHPKRYLPLNNTKILQWYLLTLFIAGSVLSTIGKKLLVQFPQLLQHFIPCYIIIATKNTYTANQHHPLIHNTIKEPTANTMILTSGFDSGSRTILVPFGPKSDQPLAVIKVANDPILNSYTHQEQQTLITLHKILPITLRNSIPQPSGSTTYNKKTISIETPAQGIPLWTLLQETSTTLHQKIEILDHASQWIAQFHQATTREHISVEIFLEKWIQTITETYQHHFGKNPTVETLLNKVKAESLPFKENRIPLVWQHFDYSPWNIYQNHQQLTVIDWEYGRTTQTDAYGPPICDLVYFMKYWLHAIQKTNTPDEELAAFHFLLPTGKVTAACQQSLIAYCKALKIPTNLIPLLTLYTWMEQAVHQVERQILQGNAQQIPNKAYLYVEALAHHQHQFLTI